MEALPVNLNLKLAILRSYPSQRAFAARTGIPEVDLSQIIRGRRAPSPTIRRRIARKLGRPENELFGR